MPETTFKDFENFFPQPKSPWEAFIQEQDQLKYGKRIGKDVLGTRIYDDLPGKKPWELWRKSTNIEDRRAEDYLGPKLETPWQRYQRYKGSLTYPK